MSCATAMSRRRRGGSTCIAAPCSASSPSAPRNRLELEAARRIEMQLQTQRRGAGEAEQHRLAPRGRYTFLDRLAHQLGAVAIGKDEARAGGDHVAGKIRPDGEIEPVAEREVILPLSVGLIVEQAGLDLDDSDVARGRQGYHVGAAAVGER